MNETHEFYPMVTPVVKMLISLAEEEWERNTILYLLNNYPKETNKPSVWVQEGKCSDKIYHGTLYELDRQYARWGKGGAK